MILSSTIETANCNDRELIVTRNKKRKTKGRKTEGQRTRERQIIEKENASLFLNTLFPTRSAHYFFKADMHCHCEARLSLYDITVKYLTVHSNLNLNVSLLFIQVVKLQLQTWYSVWQTLFFLNNLQTLVKQNNNNKKQNAQHHNMRITILNIRLY